MAGIKSTWFFLAAGFAWGADLPSNTWVQLAKDPVGARRGSAIRYAPDAGVFILWGFFDHDPALLQQHPLMMTPEYDVVAFDLAEGRWRNHLPRQREAEWTRQLPFAYIPRTYSAITTGSERTVLRGPAEQGTGIARPDLNIVFDQVAYHSELKSLVYFTGGLTAAYDPAARTWSDLQPRRSPPPVVGGSLAYDPVNREIVLFGGGHVVERRSDGKLAGHTGTWAFGDGDWRQLPDGVQPPPRMNTRLVTDPRNRVMVLFGGDGQSHFLADTWRYDLPTRTWRRSRAAGPEARAGHFTVYDPETGWVIIGGGYNQSDLTDMWAYDAAEDRWRSIGGGVPAGFYLSADIAPERRLITLVTNTRRQDDRMTCNVLYPVRTTYGYRIDKQSLAGTARVESRPRSPISKKSATAAQREDAPSATKIANLPPNQWVLLNRPTMAAPMRTWGAATFDTKRSEILYWGGGHCGYGGSDVDAYSPETNQWRAAVPAPEFPERAWDKGVRLAGVTFNGSPWVDHGRRIYAYDPVSSRMIMVRTIRLTTGYDPEALREYPAERTVAEDALVHPPSSYVRYATFSYDPVTGRWELLGPAPAGVDTLVTTPRGVMGVNVDWPSRLNDAGYLLPWSSANPARDNAVYLLNADQKLWTRLGGPQSSPQNLYEMTSLAYDTKRDRLLLHGGGKRRDELWGFDVRSGRWTDLNPRVLAPQGALPPACSREAIYIPREDVALTCGPAPEDRTVLAVWEYSPGENAWRRVAAPFAGSIPRSAASQNRAMVYDPKNDLVLLVLSAEQGQAAVYGMRYRGAER